MFKKLRKRRLSLNFKKKSTSLKNINVVGTFVHQTAKIMSASAESLNSESASSVSLVTLVDQSFQPSFKCQTAPTSNIGSPRSSYKPSRQSDPTDTSCPIIEKETEIHYIYYQVNSDRGITNSQNIEIIFEENNVSELLNSFIECNDNHMQDSFSSDIFDSPKHSIIKHPLKRSYSFNDLNIKHVKSPKKKHGSIQTFISTNATLSVEFESKPEYSSEHLTSDDLQFEKKEVEYVPFPVDLEPKIESYTFKILSHPFFIAGVTITGIVIMIPVFIKFSNWLPDAPSKPPEEETVVSLKPLGPEFLFTQPSPAIQYLQSRILSGAFNPKSNIKLTSYIPSIIHDQIKRGTLFISQFFRDR